MSFLLAAGDYPDLFPGVWWRMPPELGSPSLPSYLSWWLLVITLMSFLVAAGDYPPGGCWWFLVAAGDYPGVFPGGCS